MKSAFIHFDERLAIIDEGDQAALRGARRLEGRRFVPGFRGGGPDG